MTSEAADLSLLIEAASRAYVASYSPYSNVRVGAALQANDGTLFTGCNMEVINYTGGICAERNALSTAIAAGKRSFTHVVVVSDRVNRCWPCGVCREVLSEFGDMVVVVRDSDGSVVQARLSDLLPYHCKM